MNHNTVFFSKMAGHKTSYHDPMPHFLLFDAQGDWTHM